MHIVLVVSLAAGAMLASVGAAHAQGTSPPALRTLVQTFQEAWDAHDATRLAELFTDDADQIMGNGPVTVGRAAIRRWWDTRFAEMERGRRIALTLNSVRLISPDVGVINTVGVSADRDPQGRPRAADEDRGAWVVVNRAGQWRIAALRVHAAERSPSR